MRTNEEKQLLYDRVASELGRAPWDEPDRSYQAQVRAFKAALLRAALERTDGNRTHAAALLGLQRTYLVRLLRELEVPGIPPARVRGGRLSEPPNGGGG